jgi:hypothetical protein
MAENKPLGIKLISLYLLIKAVALITVSAIGFLIPELRSSANEFIFHFVASFKQLQVVDYGIVVAALFASFEMIKAFGLWHQKRWARFIVLADIYYFFGRGVLGLVALSGIDHSKFSSITSSPYFIIGLTQRLIVLFYLLDPDVKRAFGVPDDEAW